MALPSHVLEREKVKAQMTVSIGAGNCTFAADE